MKSEITHVSMIVSEIPGTEDFQIIARDQDGDLVWLGDYIDFAENRINFVGDAYEGWLYFAENEVETLGDVISIIEEQGNFPYGNVTAKVVGKAATRYFAKSR